MTEETRNSPLNILFDSRHILLGLTPLKYRNFREKKKTLLKFLQVGLRFVEKGYASILLILQTTVIQLSNYVFPVATRKNKIVLGLKQKR